jgi:preprotein translocase subunit SecG
MTEIGPLAQVVLGPVLVVAGVLLYARRGTTAMSFQRGLELQVPRGLAQLYARVAWIPGMVFVVVGIALTAVGVVRLA